MRCLSALLLAGLVAQTAVAASHPALPVHSGVSHAPPAEEGEHGHDPVACSLCPLAAVSEAGLLGSPLVLPCCTRMIRHRADAIPAPPDMAPWCGVASRAPPSPASA